MATITLNIPDELIALAKKYLPDLTLTDVKNTAKSAINSMVAQKISEIIGKQQDINKEAAIAEAINEIISYQIT